MTCFWEGLFKSLKQEDFDLFNIQKKDLNLKSFILFLKQKNIKTNNVLWNQKPLKKKELQENYQAVKDLDEKKINHGYLCSSCDPFLLLISELFMINIVYNFNGTPFEYRNLKKCRKKINYKSSKTHFYTD